MHLTRIQNINVSSIMAESLYSKDFELCVKSLSNWEWRKFLRGIMEFPPCVTYFHLLLSILKIDKRNKASGESC